MTEFEKYIIDELKKINDRLSISTNNEKAKYSLYEWFDVWYETYKKPRYKNPMSLVNLQGNFRNHIKPNIEDKNLNDIAIMDIENLLNKIEKSYTRKYTFNNLNNMFRYAKTTNIIKNNIMLDVDKVYHEYMNGKALTHEQQLDFLRKIKNNKKENLYKFYLLTGVRRSEILLIKWSDVDYDNKLLHVRGTKSKSSNRYMPLFDDLIVLLKQIPKTSEYIFATTLDSIKCSFKRIQKKLNYKITIHYLRHTFATRCLENGINLKVVQKWLGHAKIDTTANIYSHILSDFELEEVKKYNIKVS